MESFCAVDENNHGSRRFVMSELIVDDMLECIWENNDMNRMEYEWLSRCGELMNDPTSTLTRPIINNSLLLESVGVIQHAALVPSMAGEEDFFRIYGSESRGADIKPTTSRPCINANYEIFTSLSPLNLKFPNECSEPRMICDCLEAVLWDADPNQRETVTKVVRSSLLYHSLWTERTLRYLTDRNLMTFHVSGTTEREYREKITDRQNTLMVGLSALQKHLEQPVCSIAKEDNDFVLIQPLFSNVNIKFDESRPSAQMLQRLADSDVHGALELVCAATDMRVMKAKLGKPHPQVRKIAYRNGKVGVNGKIGAYPIHSRKNCKNSSQSTISETVTDAPDESDGVEDEPEINVSEGDVPLLVGSKRSSSAVSRSAKPISKQQLAKIVGKNASAHQLLQSAIFPSIREQERISQTAKERLMRREKGHLGTELDQTISAKHARLSQNHRSDSISSDSSSLVSIDEDV